MNLHNIYSISNEEIQKQVWQAQRQEAEHITKIRYPENNFSEHQLTKEEKKALVKGSKFAIAPSNIPKKESITPIGAALRNLSTEEAENIWPKIWVANYYAAYITFKLGTIQPTKEVEHDGQKNWTPGINHKTSNRRTILYFEVKVTGSQETEIILAKLPTKHGW